MRSITKSSMICSLLLLCALPLTGATIGGGRTDTTIYAEEEPSPYPIPDHGYVTDLAGLLTDDQQERIERLLWQTESRTQVEIIVVTIDSIRDYPGADDKGIESFAKGLFAAYEIGNMPGNDGVLLLVARKDRKVRIELGAGYAPDRERDGARIVNDVVIPRFTKNEYADGIEDGVKAIMLEFAHVRVGYNWPLIGVAIGIPVVGLIAYSLFRSGKRGWGWAVVGLLITLVLALIYIVFTALRHMPKGRSSSWSPGGLGGFGGGFSGGGGATGSW